MTRPTPDPTPETPAGAPASQAPQAASVPSLEQVLADARSEARALARHAPSAPIAEAVLALCDAVAEAAEDYLKWLSEPDAALRSGRSARFWRGRFNELAQLGHAELRGRVRYYRACVIPQRVDAAALRRAGLEGRALTAAELGEARPGGARAA